MPDDLVNQAVSFVDQAQMAMERTYLAHERTLLAWVRTGTSLVTFGFTLYKFFQYLHEQYPDRHPASLLGARPLGMMLIAIGVLTLALACWQHRQATQRLRKQCPDIPFSPAYVLAALMAALGVLALIAPLFQR
jgi:putative membrane protein